MPGVAQKGGKPIHTGSSPSLVSGQDSAGSFIERVYSDASGQPTYQSLGYDRQES